MAVDLTDLVPGGPARGPLWEALSRRSRWPASSRLRSATGIAWSTRSRLSRCRPPPCSRTARTRRLGQPARRRDARRWPDAPKEEPERAGEAKAPRTARHPARGHGPQSARHYRPPRGARRRRRSPRASARPTGATSTSPTCSWRPAERRPRAVAGAGGAVQARARVGIFPPDMTVIPRWTFWSQFAEIASDPDDSNRVRREHDVLVRRMQTAPDPTAVYRSFHRMHPKDDDPDPGLWAALTELGPVGPA